MEKILSKWGIQMDDISGTIIVFFIILALIYALLKQIRYTKWIGNNIDNPFLRKKIKRNNKIMTFSLFGVLIFYIINISIAFDIMSEKYITSNFTSIGIIVSFIIYIVAKFFIKPKSLNQSKNLYN